MKYKNALCIYVYLHLITVTYGTHIGQENIQEGPEEIEPNKNVSKENTDNLEQETVHISKNVGRHASASLEEAQSSLDYDSNDSEYSQIEAKESLENVVDEYEPSDPEVSYEERQARVEDLTSTNPDCWMSLNATSLMETMDTIDNSYAGVRKSIQEDTVTNEFNEKMLQAMLQAGGAAARELYRTKDRRDLIPAGLNLGGFCMMRMPDSIMFFHRIKLRNNTQFRINYLDNDLANMVLTARLSLNDLHLRGAYERSPTDQDPSVLFYVPTFGEVDLLLKNVEYKMEGRYRLIKERLVIELVISEILVKDILMMYVNGALENPSIKVDKVNIEEFLDRMKTDLDKWLKDYFNDFLIYTELQGIRQLDQLEKYDKEKAITLNEYMDNALNIIRNRIREQTAAAIKMPKFQILGNQGFEIKLHNGLFRGLDSIYRRSVATTNKQKDVRKVDSIVGFSDLKVTYQYQAKIPNGVPSMSGVLTLSANELAAHLSLAMVKDPESVDINIDFLDQTKPESLTVEGSANTMISNFKHLLEHQIVAIMSNTLVHGIKTLRYLPKCEPYLPGQKYSENLIETDGHHQLNIYQTYSDLENPKKEGEFSGLRTKRHSKNSRKNNSESKKKKRGFKKRNKHSKKKSRSYKKKNKRSKKKDKHGHKRT